MIVCPFKDLGRYAAILPGLDQALAAIEAMEDWTVGTTPLPNGRIMAQEGLTRSARGARCEAHRQYLDIQYILEGEETVGWAPLDALTPAGPFDEQKDIGFYDGPVEFLRIAQGNCYVVFPEDAHAPGVSLDGPHAYKKLVVKLKL